MSLDHINTLCTKIVEDASSLNKRYDSSVENLERASSLLDDEQKLLNLACLVSRLVQVRKESEQSIQKLLFLTAYDIKYSGGLGLSKKHADARAMELVALARKSLGLLEALLLRAEGETSQLNQLEESSSPEKDPEAHFVSDSNRETAHVLRNETYNSSMVFSPFYQEESLDTPTLINKNGIWIKTYNGIHLESPDTQRATAFGRLKQDFDKQCVNILILEKERNALLHRADTLELEKVSMDAKYTRLQEEVMELRKTITILRRKLAVDENKWNSRLEVAKFQVSELHTNRATTQDRPNSSANLVSSK